jgi:hypothetical protein
MWRPFDNGRSVGARGSENGITVLDEEHDWGARTRRARTAEMTFTD